MELHTHVAGYAVRFLSVQPLGEVDRTMKGLEKIETRFTVPDMFFEYDTFLVIEFSIDIFG